MDDLNLGVTFKSSIVGVEVCWENDHDGRLHPWKPHTERSLWVGLDYIKTFVQISLFPSCPQPDCREHRELPFRVRAMLAENLDAVGTPNKNSQHPRRYCRKTRKITESIDGSRFPRRELPDGSQDLPKDDSETISKKPEGPRLFSRRDLPDGSQDLSIDAIGAISERTKAPRCSRC